MPRKEVSTIVIYDITDTKIRNRIAEICKDYGLKRIQYSAFIGRINRNMREELFFRLADMLGDNRGRILVIPMCEQDWCSRLEVENM